VTKREIDSLLKAWSRAVLGCEDLRDRLPPNALSRQWAGEPPASAEAIAAAETRLGRKLPREYRAFLQISNGWQFLDEDGRHLLPVEQIDTLARLDPALVDAYPRPLIEAGVPDDESDGGLPASHYPTLIRISADSDGFYLLDPLDSVPGGWATRFFANWLPGAGEAISFGELLQSRYHAFLSARGLDAASTAPKQRKLNLRVPPKEPRTDPAEFLRVLIDLGYFDRTPSEVAESMRSAFLEACRRKIDHPDPAVRYRTSPMSELVRIETGRLCWLDTPLLAQAGVGYVARQVSPLLAARGLVLPAVEETRGEIHWNARLAGVEATVCRMKNGRPHGLGMEHVENVAQVVMNASAVLLNRYLREVGSEHRVANVTQLDAEDLHSAFIHGVIVTTDEQSYELMWAGLGGTWCQVIRADVFS
jgi:hypothetical protein